MRFKFSLALAFLIAIAITLFVFLYPYGVNSSVLRPSGTIALEERDLIALSTVLMLIIVIPVLLMAFFICLRYRASNKKAKYAPYWDYDLWAESLWWGFPLVIVIALSVVAWRSSFALDPFKTLSASEKPLHIQVIALQWKWLFIYPEQKIATLNFVRLPEKRPVHFEITADAPMNSFWIPALAGQIYAMPGMRSQLHLVADESGNFRGSSANLSGTGFAHMSFNVVASSQQEFDTWVEKAKQSQHLLEKESYNLLAQPNIHPEEETYGLADENLYDRVVMKFMTPAPNIPVHGITTE